MADDEQPGLDDLREQVERIDTNQEELIDIMKALRAKIVEISSSEGEPDSDTVKELEEELKSVRKKVQQTKLSEGKELSELKGDMKELKEQFEQLQDVVPEGEDVAEGGLHEAVEDLEERFEELREQASSDGDAEMQRAVTDLEAMWKEVQGLTEKQRDITRLVEETKDSMSQLQNVLDAEDIDIDRVVEQVQEETEEMRATIQGIEQMFRDVGRMRQETGVLVEGISSEHTDILRHMNDIDKRLQNTMIEEKVDHSRLEQEVEELRGRVQDVSWVEERLERLALDETVDSAELRQEIRDIKETLSDRSEIHQIQRRLDQGVAQELGLLERKMSALNEELDDLTSREQQDKKAIQSVREDVDDLLELTSNIQLIEDAHDKLGHLKERVAEHEDAEDQEIQRIAEQVASLETQLQETVSDVRERQETLLARTEELKKRVDRADEIFPEVDALEDDMKELSNLVLDVVGR